MQKLAERGATDLERPLRNIEGVTRAVEAWFGMYGDPFDGVPAEAFTEQLAVSREHIGPQLDNVGAAHVLALFLESTAVLKQRFDSARNREEF